MHEESHLEIKSTSSIANYWSKSLQSKCLRGYFFNTSKCLRDIIGLCLTFSRYFVCGKRQCCIADSQHGRWMKIQVGLSQDCLKSDRTWTWPWKLCNEIHVDVTFWLISSTNAMWLIGLWFLNFLENLKIPLFGQAAKIHSNISVKWKLKGKKNPTFLEWIKCFIGLKIPTFFYRRWHEKEKTTGKCWVFTLNQWKCFQGESCVHIFLEALRVMERSTEACTSYILTMCAMRLVTECITDAQQMFCTELILTEWKNTKPISFLARIIKCLYGSR